MPLGKEIKVWESLMKVELTELEIQLILELDSQYRASMGKELQKQADSSAAKPPDRNYDL
jgi:hypothetical protein